MVDERENSDIAPDILDIMYTKDMKETDIMIVVLNFTKIHC